MLECARYDADLRGEHGSSSMHLNSILADAVDRLELQGHGAIRRRGQEC